MYRPKSNQLYIFSHKKNRKNNICTIKRVALVPLSNSKYLKV